MEHNWNVRQNIDNACIAIAYIPISHFKDGNEFITQTWLSQKVAFFGFIWKPWRHWIRFYERKKNIRTRGYALGLRESGTIKIDDDQIFNALRWQLEAAENSERYHCLFPSAKAHGSCCKDDNPKIVY